MSEKKKKKKKIKITADLPTKSTFQNPLSHTCNELHVEFIEVGRSGPHESTWTLLVCLLLNRITFSAVGYC